MDRFTLWISVVAVAVNAAAAGSCGESSEWSGVALHVSLVLVSMFIIWLEWHRSAPTISTTKHTQGEG